ncbi:hypothetical protein NDU88_006632 [Pleurodeles waltl]|uniref:Uncharacterized protein n=1 Tax=Pleurodeles waltl TaxID=8319 RepID=A0AAV7PP04_PLEWA|nr:hypothetical protein NDU88_006632 [Pleurodeles waltl]
MSVLQHSEFRTLCIGPFVTSAPTWNELITMATVSEHRSHPGSEATQRKQKVAESIEEYGPVLQKQAISSLNGSSSIVKNSSAR